jgi:hypothetical protein
MAVTSGQMTIGQTAQQIDGTSNQPFSIHLNNNSSSLVLYVGGSSAVTSTTGLKLAANDSMDINLMPGDNLWVISSSNNHDISWLRISQ